MTTAAAKGILLGSDYYNLLRDNARMVDGLPLLDEAAIIPFKARAHLDLAAGEAVDSANVKKHRSDVFRLLQLLPEGEGQPRPEAIRADMIAFVEAVAKDPTFKPSDLKVKMTPQEAIGRLVGAYGL